MLPRVVPFATPPFYANSDDQTIFNDVLSAVDVTVVQCDSRATGRAYRPPACRAYLRRRAACPGLRRRPAAAGDVGEIQGRYGEIWGDMGQPL